MAVRNEDWCLGLTARVALMWCDAIVILLHECTDGSFGICQELGAEFGDRVDFATAEGDWQEMDHRQQLLNQARRHEATHIAIIDADEILTGNLLPSKTALNTINTYFEALKPSEIIHLPGYNLRVSLNQYHSNGIWGNRWFSTAFADHPRLGWAGDNFHAREPKGLGTLKPYRPIAQGQGGVLHLWGASERRLRAKHAMYKVSERLRWPDKPIAQIERMYNLWRSPADCLVEYPEMKDWGKPWTFADVPESWWTPYVHLMKYLDINAEPWQEKWVREQVIEHEADRFKGLDLFGIV